MFQHNWKANRTSSWDCKISRILDVPYSIDRLKLIDFKGISTRLGIFYALSQRIEHIIRPFLHLLCSCIFKVYLRSVQSNRNNFNTFIRPIDGSLTCTTSPGQSGHGSNSNECVLHTPQNSRTQALPSNEVWYHSQSTNFFRGLGTYLFAVAHILKSGVCGWFGFFVLMAYQLFLCYLMPKLFSNKNSSGTI